MGDVRERNREVLDAVRVRRDALYDSVMLLEQALATPAGGGAADWCRLLHDRIASLRTVLEAHVLETETDGGFFDDVRDQAPQLLPVVEQLQAEHAPLLATTDDLERQIDAVSGSGDVQSARAAGLDLIRRLLEHRHRGAELVYDAYSVDISAAD